MRWSRFTGSGGTAQSPIMRPPGPPTGLRSGWLYRMVLGEVRGRGRSDCSSVVLDAAGVRTGKGDCRNDVPAERPRVRLPAAEPNAQMNQELLPGRCRRFVVALSR